LASSASAHSRDRAPTRSPYSDSVLENDTATSMVGTASANRRTIAPSSVMPWENPWYAMSMNGTRPRSATIAITRVHSSAVRS